MLTPLPFTKVRILDTAWLERIDLLRRVVLPYQWEILNDRVEGAEKSHCIRNFKAAARDVVAEHSGVVFLDSDLYKWLEAVAYVLAIRQDEPLSTLADEAVDLIARAQEKDGYLNTYYSLMRPQERYSNLMEGHELYCAGHMIEAAVAYAQATGKEKLLRCAIKLAKHLHGYFMPRSSYPGHPEIELALIRLYEYSAEASCLELARHFIDVRGCGENQLERERNDPHHAWIWEDMKRFDDAYFQAHKPVREQDSAEGHAVRAMYLYSAMADAARHLNDEALLSACQALAESVRTRRMYVTGGIGSASFGERFTADWDLPNDSMYCETCASVGLMLFSRRMTFLTGDVSYYDLWERALDNTVLAGMGQDGKHFFYVNPLAVRPETIRKNMTYAHVKPVRQAWFGVACCPPNIARTLSSLSGSLYAQRQGELYILAHIASAYEDECCSIRLDRQGEEVCLTLRSQAVDVHLRIPEGYAFSAQGGDTRGKVHVFRHPGGTAQYVYRLSPRIRLIHAHPRVAANAGKICLMRGLDVYCLEEKDNGPWLSGIRLRRDAQFQELPGQQASGLPILETSGFRLKESAWGHELYTENLPAYEPCRLTFVPYRFWGNRGEGEMLVWINQYPGT